MKIKKIEFRNFASYGNKTQVIEFDEKRGNFYLVLGKNGSGKSSISDVIKFALYGKLQNKKLYTIPNRFNGAAWCRITVIKDAATTVVIERGINPGIFTCHVNGVEYDQAGKRNVQNFIEEEILGIPFYVYNNIVSLSINDFKSFLNMRPGDKRKIIDKIFDLEIINNIRELVKKDIKEIQDSVSVLTGQIEIINQSIARSDRELKLLKSTIIEDSDKKTRVIQDDIVKYDELRAKIVSKLAEVQQKQKEIADKRQLCTKMLNAQRVVISRIEEKEKLYENDKCPTCEGSLCTSEHEEVKNRLVHEKAEAIKESNVIKERLEKIKNAITKISGVVNKFSSDKGKLDAKLSFSKSELDKLSKGDNSKQYESLDKILKDTINNAEMSIESKNKKEGKIKFYSIIDDIFSDKGVKRMAIQRILPTLNSEINNAMKEMNIEFRVSFDEDFNAKISHLGHEVASDMLSTGEKKKLDFAILTSIIRLMKRKFPGMNLIFLDEIFSSVDQDGIYQILKILSESCKELNLNQFVINHSTLPAELFDYKVIVEKTNGFSNLEIERVD